MNEAEHTRASNERAADGLARGEVVILDGWLGPERARAVRDEVTALLASPHSRPAGVGARTDRVVAPDVRSDTICWIVTDNSDDTDAARPGPAVADYVAHLEQLAQHLNETCFLGLRRIACHAACFEPGAFYQAHKDAFRRDASRVVSVCYYLNEAWTEEAGGCLRIHADPVVDVPPLFDRLVLFRSADVLHQVMPSTVRRLSLTGWLSRTQ